MVLTFVPILCEEAAKDGAPGRCSLPKSLLPNATLGFRTRSELLLVALKLSSLKMLPVGIASRISS